MDTGPSLALEDGTWEMPHQGDSRKITKKKNQVQKQSAKCQTAWGKQSNTKASKEEKKVAKGSQKKPKVAKGSQTEPKIVKGSQM